MSYCPVKLGLLQMLALSQQEARQIPIHWRNLKINKDVCLACDIRWLFKADEVYLHELSTMDLRQIIRIARGEELEHEWFIDGFTTKEKEESK